jgi:hypothetical protein
MVRQLSEEMMDAAIQTYISIKRGYKMHPSSIERMKEFINNHLDKSHTLNILDVGSESYGGDSYRILFDNPTWHYYGLDLQEGANVDIVSIEPYHCGNIRPSSRACRGYSCLDERDIACIETSWIGMYYSSC